jgi:hypothetical protein
MPNQTAKITYVGMRVEYGIDGKITQLVIRWPDGRDFKVDELISVKPTITVGSGFGNRYLCRVKNKEVSLYNDTVEGKWYVKHS